MAEEDHSQILIRKITEKDTGTAYTSRRLNKKSSRQIHMSNTLRLIKNLNLNPSVLKCCHIRGHPQGLLIIAFSELNILLFR